ncbi:MAG: hypothetical protein IPO65_16380 [Saprospiraceae bacterium]|nr:hypothetical protein [Saprospiraceae bacterium]
MQDFKEQWQLEQPRDFGTILADAALLIYRNWQALLTALAFVTLPFIGLSFVIYFAFLANLSQEALLDIANEHILALVALMLIFVMATITSQLVAIAFVYTSKRLGLMKFEPIELWHTMRPKLSKLLAIYTLTWILPLTVIGLCALIIMVSKVVGVVLLIAAVIAFIWFTIGAMFAGYMGMESDLSPVDCIKKTLEMVNVQWWEAFGYVVLLSIVINAVHGVIFMPFTVLELIKNFSAISSGNAEGLQQTTLSLLSMFQSALFILFMCFTAICYNLKFYDLRENKHGYNILQKIDSIGSHLTKDEEL